MHYQLSIDVGIEGREWRLYMSSVRMTEDQAIIDHDVCPWPIYFQCSVDLQRCVSHGKREEGRGTQTREVVTTGLGSEARLGQFALPSSLSPSAPILYFDIYAADILRSRPHVLSTKERFHFPSRTSVPLTRWKLSKSTVSVYATSHTPQTHKPIPLASST